MNEHLSRLLSGDLPEAEAEALRERIANEPELASQWARMTRVVAGLEALPDELPPPVVRRASRPWLPMALAAALGLALLWPRPVPTVYVADGTETVEGRAEVLAGDVVVAVDGKVVVSVEPPAGVMREKGAEIPKMDRTHFLAALGGSFVTVLVLEGTAQLNPAQAEPVTLTAGETRSVGTPPAAPKVATPKKAEGGADRELAALKLEHAATLGQLRALGGAPVDWPKDLPSAYRQEAFDRFVRERVATVPEASVVTIDCDEYPCLAIVRSNSDAPDWQERVNVLHEDLDGTPFGEKVHVFGYGSEHNDGERGVRLYGFAIAPENGEDSGLRSRLDVRMRGALEGAAEELVSDE